MFDFMKEKMGFINFYLEHKKLCLPNSVLFGLVKVLENFFVKINNLKMSNYYFITAHFYFFEKFYKKTNKNSIIIVRFLIFANF